MSEKSRLAPKEPSQSPHRVAWRAVSLDKAPQIKGQLGPGGFTSLEIDDGNSNHQHTNDSPRHSTATPDSHSASADSDSISTASEEDYDKIRHDPQVMVSGGRGGGFEGSNEEGPKIHEKLYANITASASDPKLPGHLRLKSVPVTLTMSDEKGKYTLTADDEQLRSMLNLTAERARNGTSKEQKRRSKFSDLVFTRQFTAFDRLNSEYADSPFHGFYNLFWLCTAVFMIRLAAQNWAVYGNILGSNEILGLMLRRDLLVLGLSDGVLFITTGFGWALQKLVQKEYITWDKEGWIIQNIWQLIYTAAFVSWTLYREWPWTHTVFFVIHGIVMLMKQHSYAFYNGYLSEAYKSRQHLGRILKQLEHLSPAQQASTASLAVSSLATEYLHARTTSVELNQRRHSIQATKDGPSDVKQVVTAIEKGESLDAEQIQKFENLIKWEIEALSEELKGKASRSSAYYPNNLTLSNHYEYIVLPTLVYELEYPRTDNINWSYVAEKAIATIGILTIMQLVSQSFIYPVVVRTIELKEAGVPLLQRLETFPWVLSDLIFPFMGEYLLVWYLIWEIMLNLLAELTYFADRGFYADWWNSISWDQFARDWNRPVHNFLLRHVYHSSISSMHVNKKTATLITFFLSACIHELVMWCLFKKLRGYLLFFQMSQLPLVQLSRSRWLKGKSTLGNLIFWVGIFTGPSLLCSLYLII